MEDHSMKTKFSIISVIIILSIIFMGTVTPASALPGSNWATGIKLQNLSTDVDAIISINLYDTGGAKVSTITTTSFGTPLIVPKAKSVEVYLPSYTSLPNSQFSAEILSSAPIGAVATMTNYEYGIADSYNSMSPSTEVFVPYVYHNHNSWSTEIFIQNTTNVSITGQVIFVEPPYGPSSGDGLANLTKNFSVPANGTISFNTSNAEFVSLEHFIGGARITSSQPISVVSNQVRIVGLGDVQGNVLIQNRGLSVEDSGNLIILPSLYKNFSGVSGTWNAGIKLVNQSSSSSVTAKVVFNSDPYYPSFTGEKTVTILANNIVELYLPAVTLDDSRKIPDQFKGSAKVTVIGSGSVLANVQHTNYNAANGYGVALGYTGFTSGHSQIVLPSLYKWPSGAGIWISGIKVQNVGTDTVTVKIDLKADSDISTWSGSQSNIVIEPGKAYELYLGVNGNLDGGASIPQPFRGSAVITASGIGELKIASTVIHTNYGRHVANMYTGIGVIP